eukprot:Awhi_evm3s1128
MLLPNQPRYNYYDIDVERGDEKFKDDYNNDMIEKYGMGAGTPIPMEYKEEIERSRPRNTL